MMARRNRLDAVLAAIDAANACDPNGASDGNRDVPAELLYGRRMSAELDRMSPDASDHLRIAARGQHIERWTSPRSAYPEGRAGYLKWRKDLGAFHARRVGELMAEAGYDEVDQARVGALLRKEGIKRDPEVQMLEDVICLVFMRWYFADFAAKHSEERVLDIVAKTGRKMSGEGRRAALSLGLPDDLATALQSKAGAA